MRPAQARNQGRSASRDGGEPTALAGLPPEERALRLAAAPRLGWARRARLFESLSVPLPWDRLFDRARYMGVLPLLSHHLGRDPLLRAAVPRRMQARVEEGRVATVGRNILLFHALGEVLDALAATGVGVAPLKGAFLVPEVYGGFHLRTSSDLDLLVRREDLPEIDRALRGLGYLPHRAVHRYLGPGADPHVTSVFYRRPGEDRYFLDLRWDLVEIPALAAAGLFPVRMEEVWAATGSWRWEGHEARALSPVHHLIYVCLHAMKHAFHPTMFLVDIAAVWSWGRASPGDPRVSAEDLLRWARRWRLEACLRMAFRLADAVVGVEDPPAFRGGGGGWGERAVRRCVLEGREAPGVAYLIYLDHLRSWRRRLGFLRRTFFPTAEAIPWADDGLLDGIGLGERGRRVLRGIAMSARMIRGGSRRTAPP